MFEINYNPRSLDDIYSPHELVQNLKKINVHSNPLDHVPSLLIYGPNYVDKVQLIRCFLHDFLDERVHEIKEIEHICKNNSSVYTTVIKKSYHHYELDLNGLQFADRVVLMDILDIYCSTQHVSNMGYKIVVVDNFHVLSKPAQFSLRRRMELVAHSVKFIFLCDTLSGIESAIMSRACSLRCSKPSNTEIVDAIHCVFDKSMDKIQDASVMDTIIQKSIELGDYKLPRVFTYFMTCLEIYNATHTLDDIHQITTPQKTLISHIDTILKSKHYDHPYIKDYISQILLSKLDLPSVFCDILYTCETLFPQHMMNQICQMIQSYQMKCSTSNHSMVLLESMILELYILKKTT